MEAERKHAVDRDDIARRHLVGFGGGNTVLLTASAGSLGSQLKPEVLALEWTIYFSLIGQLNKEPYLDKVNAGCADKIVIAVWSSGVGVSGV